MCGCVLCSRACLLHSLVATDSTWLSSSRPSCLCLLFLPLQGFCLLPVSGMPFGAWASPPAMHGARRAADLLACLCRPPLASPLARFDVSYAAPDAEEAAAWGDPPALREARCQLQMMSVPSGGGLSVGGGCAVFFFFSGARAGPGWALSKEKAPSSPREERTGLQ